MILGARGWCTGMTQSDGIGREVGGGFMMGNICIPMVDSCQLKKNTKEDKRSTKSTPNN